MSPPQSTPPHIAPHHTDTDFRLPCEARLIVYYSLLSSTTYLHTLLVYSSPLFYIPCVVLERPFAAERREVGVDQGGELVLERLISEPEAVKPLLPHVGDEDVGGGEELF